MAEPLSISSVAANSQMTALAAVQSQLSSESNRATAAAAPVAERPSAPPAASANSPAAAKPANSAPPKAASKPTADELQAATKKLQEYFQPDQKVSLNVDHDSGESVVKVVDVKSKQLILQIPSKEVLAMARKLREAADPQSASGVLVDREG